MIRFVFAIILLICLPFKILCQSNQIIFEQSGHVEVADWVRSMYQDSRGLLWIGTVDDIRRYDGYESVSYKPVPYDTCSVSGDYIQCIWEDKSAMLWFGTLSDGLNRYNRYTDKFTRYRYKNTDSLSLSNNRINTIFEDREGILWIGTGDGLNKFNQNDNNFTCYKQGNSPKLNNINDITAINDDDIGLLWIGTATGLYVFDKSREEFSLFGEYYELSDDLKSKHITTIYKDTKKVFWIGSMDGFYQAIPESGKLIRHPLIYYEEKPVYANHIQAISDGGDFLWIGTTDGLFKFDKITFQINRYGYDPENYLSLLEDNIKTILRDRNGCTWFGLTKGVNKINNIRKGVKYYIPNPFNHKSIEEEIMSQCLSRTGKIWIGTSADGLLSYNKRNDEFQIYQHIPDIANSLSNNEVRTIMEDKKGIVWIGTADGLNRFDPEKNIFSCYRNQVNNTYSISSNQIHSLLETSDGSIYIGTVEGLNILNPANEKMRRYQNDEKDPYSISNNAVRALYEDSKHSIWIGTYGGGLNRFDPKTEQFVHYMNDPANPYSISSNTVEAIYEYPYKNRPSLWIGTRDGGLCRFDIETEQFHMLGKKDGLESNRVEKIITDHRGNFWLATVWCIVKYDPVEQTFKNFELSSEMPVNPHTCLIDHDGEIFFGGYRGFVRFFPDSLKDNPYLPQTIITEFRVNNQPAQLDTVITEKKSVILSYEENVISFGFSALDYNRPEMNQYAYKLDGLDKDWVYTDASRRYAAYTNLNPGEYVFRVKGSNNDGIWNEEGKAVKIIITPPWWRTNFAYAFYLILLLIIIYFVRQYDLRRQRLKHELALQHEHSKKLQEIDRMKSRFFANISHEFRTPLTLILGPIKKWLPQLRNSNLKQDMNMMQRNANRLYRLINQLLDLSRLESGGMTLQVRNENIVHILKGYVQSFESLAKIKKISLDFKTNKESVNAYVDRDKIEKIMYNLLSNAFKFTPEEGVVKVAVSSGRSIEKLQSAAVTADYLKITVSNSGSYIAPEKIDCIFDRFYQADDSVNREHEGSGIGLALTKELVELHHGLIAVESKIDAGTTFTVSLPLGKDHLKEHEISDSIPLPTYHPNDELLLDTGTTKNIPVTLKKDLPLIMIVEDNPDVQYYMRSYLDNSFRILEACNGKEGFETAIEKIPDLIISDVMMPVMDGFTFCEKIKTDERTSHIPIILLTARADADSKIAGLETGADDYLSKPFDVNELHVRIKNLIIQRQKLREHYRKEGILHPQEMDITSTDQNFFQKALKIVENHLSDATFDTVVFAEELGMSRMQLHRKLTAIIDSTPKEFVRSLRLKHAERLLKQKFGNITQIAYEVGFNNPAYFTECFRKHFGITPFNYLQKETAQT